MGCSHKVRTKFMPSEIMAGVNKSTVVEMAPLTQDNLERKYLEKNEQRLSNENKNKTFDWRKREEHLEAISTSSKTGKGEEGDSGR